VLTTPSAYAQPNIDVQGNRRVEVATIAPISGPARAAGSVPTRSTRRLRPLYATGLFQEVNIRQAGGRIVVQVVENPVINRIQFESNSPRQGRSAQGRNPVERARDLVARRRSVGRRSR
jgi:outer membrane protein insertion porin family